jgi:hypothetical protein
VPETKTKTEPAKNAPTQAQLAQLAALTDELGVEAPELETAEDAQSAIEALQTAAAAQDEVPEPDPDEAAEEAEAEEQAAAEEAQARSGAERSDKQTQQMFERAVQSFRKSLCTVFEVDYVQPASAPGVIGFLLPGSTEKKPNELYQRCPECNGWGKVLTGSIRAGEQEADCPNPNCVGRGYWKKSRTPPPQVVQPTTAITGPTAFEQPIVLNGVDEWERPTWLGDPNLSAPSQP